MKVTIELSDDVKEFIRKEMSLMLGENQMVSSGNEWTLDDFRKDSLFPFKSKDLTKDFLNYPPYKEFFEEHGIVKYPVANRDPYLIDARKMTKWWDENKTLVLSEKKLWRTS
ncbi:DUF771 domain-containing protein [Macrococcus bovicus]|uniref:DUF771 domain-containing protein n=1 Tax=Macrococcus bovicus TaxID=69968 RepID=UPI0025A5FB93|nr:DUF771 domain-containing protein [Macrococcus bovicus]WJP97104.1 DUF771 domain-containing protein [Macrococcus bovicus]